MTDEMEVKLLPCPFCGGAAEWHDITEDDEVANVGGSCIICTVCQACGPVQFGEKDTIVEQWNRRALRPAGEASKYHLIFDGSPGPDGPRFIELENDAGHSIGVGEWVDDPRHPGWAQFVLPAYASPIIDAKVAGPVVKGLEWADGNTASIAVGYTVVAEAPGYQIEQSDTGRFYTRSSMAAEFFATIEFADTLDQAKAAAQADYEARILRALASIDAGGREECGKVHAHRLEMLAVLKQAIAIWDAEVFDEAAANAVLKSAIETVARLETQK